MISRELFNGISIGNIYDMQKYGACVEMLDYWTTWFIYWVGDKPFKVDSQQYTELIGKLPMMLIN